MAFHDDPEVLRAAWLEALRVAGPSSLDPTGLELAVHPDDDMARVDVQKVEPGRELAAYARSGHEGLACLENVLAAAGRSLGDTGALLDFAGGYGRILRWFVRALAPERIWSSDVLAPAVEFARATFGVHGFDSATDPAELRLPRRFDVIWVASLFSHLPRATFVPFLRALHEALEPGGLLVFSTHSPELLDPERRDTSGFTFVRASESHVLDLGDYGSTFVEPEVLHELAREAGVAHLAGLERELWRIQDVYVASNEPVPGLVDWRPAPIAHGSILEASVSRLNGGHARIHGFVRVPVAYAPVTAVELRLGPGDAGGEGDPRVEPCAHRPYDRALPQDVGGARFRQTDWLLEGPAPELLDTRAPLCVTARFGDGRAYPFESAWFGAI